MLTLICGSCLVVLVILILLQPRNLPPGPPGIPFIGNVGLLQEFQNNFLQIIRRLNKEYGEIFRVKIGSHVVVFVEGQNALKEIFLKNGDLISDRPSYSFIPVVSKGFGISGSSGRIWKEHRAFAIKTLKGLGFGNNSMEAQVTEEVNFLLSRVEETKGESFDIEPLLRVSVLNNVSRFLYGKRIDPGDENAQRILSLLTDGFSSKLKILFDFLPFLSYLPLNILGMQGINKQVVQLFTFFKNIVEEHRCTLDENDLRDYTDRYLITQKRQSIDPNNTFTDEQLVVSIRNLYIGAYETTTAAIRWAILFLLCNPDVQTKMREEIQQVIGPFQLPSYQRRKEFPYCQAVITESLRFGIVSPTTMPVVAKESFTYKGFNIPKGSTVYAYLESLSMDPKSFANPQIFNPDRFISETGNFKPPEGFYTFGIGKRSCIGESLARMELFLFLTMLIQRYELRLPYENTIPSMEPEIGIGVRPKTFYMKAVKVV